MSTVKNMTEDRRSFSVPVLRVSQPIGTFFIGSIDSGRLCEITEFDVRRILKERKEREFETYLGIQRPLNDKRVAEIRQYVTTMDACFPTGVILSVRGACASYDEAAGVLTLSNHMDDDPDRTVLYRQIARVIDGQHRIEGLRGFKGDGPFEVNVSIFVDIDVAEEGYIFSTVNLAQTKVNKSLAYDLFDLAKAKSPQKLCHNVAVALDSNKGSPFYRRIKRLGVATEGRFNETLTQATVVEALIGYISDNPARDRDLYVRGKTPPKAGAAESKKLIFRNMMIEDRDLEIVDILWNYFSAVRSRWSGAWDNFDRGFMLNRTNGFRAFMKLLRPVYLSLCRPGDVPTQDRFYEMIAKSSLRDGDFNIEEFAPGTSGEAALYRRLLTELGLER